LKSITHDGLFYRISLSARARIIVGILGVLLVLGVSLILFLRYQIRKSFPEISGTIAIPALQHPVDVYRDEYGVPRIVAANEHDLMIAAGFVHAQDRLWQMDIVRRAGEGRLSELFGDVTVPFDRMFRIIGLMRTSRQIAAAIDSVSLERLQWYADGVNDCIRSLKGQYPVEFDMLGYEPEPWQPVHSILIGRLMAWELNLSWWTDLTFGAIVQRVGYAKAMEVLPGASGTPEPRLSPDAMKLYSDDATEFLRCAEKYRAFMGSPGLPTGSNAWAIGPAKSASRGVLLANDTHLHLQAPSKWYEVEYVTPDYTVSGMSVPGAPGIISGHNRHIAWGITNIMADDADFYIESLDSTGTRYLAPSGRWVPIETRDEEIQVGRDSVVHCTVRSTHHGPIVTDIRTPLTKATIPFVASMRWTGTEISDQIDAFHSIDIATNWKEFVAGVRKFSGPGQNFVYGDTAGNIGYWCGVKLPIRGAVNATLPLPGWEMESEWKGFVPFERLPHLYNPPEGFIASANNRMVDSTYPYFITNLWEPSSRITRLREELGRDDLFSTDDCMRLQNDTFSHMARDLTPFILGALRSSPDTLEELQALKEYFLNWNYLFTVDDVPTAIFQAFTTRLFYNIYHDEMGDELFHDYVILVNVPVRMTMKLIEEGTSSWFDDTLTPEVETRDDIIRKSLREAVVALRSRLGPEMKSWRWSELHTVTFKHPFGLVRPLDKLFNIGPYPCPGGPTALVSGEFSYNEPFGVTVGASFRSVVDMSNPGRAFRVLPPGESGQVLNDHYDDQSPLWLNGAYRTVMLDPDHFSALSWKHLQLEPGG
jgi:penicillin amidase